MKESNAELKVKWSENKEIVEKKEERNRKRL
jgi:hypothetical protein